MIENSISQALIDEDAFNSTKRTFQTATKELTTIMRLNIVAIIRKETKKKQETQMLVFRSTIQRICQD